MSHWLLDYHPEFERNYERWLFAYDHLRSRVYAGGGDLSVIDSFVPDSFSHEILASHKRLHNVDRDYLIQPSQGEPDSAYEARQNLSSYTPYYPFAIASLTGMFFGAQETTTPQWQPEEADSGFGDPEDPDSLASRLEADFDGRGNGFESVLWEATMQMISMGQVWPVVEGVQRNQDGEKVGEAAVRVYPPLQVGNWLTQDGRLVETKLRVQVDDRTSLADHESEAEEIRHIVYDTEQWTRFVLVDRDGDVQGVEEASMNYDYYRTTDQRKRILPIFRAKLPLRGNPGYNAAREANTIFNLESSLDFELFSSSFAKFVMDVATDDGMNEDLKDEIEEAFKKGKNVIPGGEHDFLAPPTDNADVKETRIENKVVRFFRTFFQQYSDAPKERTATQIRHESQSGVESFLTTLAHGVEDMVNEMLWRLEQVYFPERPELWGQASFTATKDFDPVDLEDQVDKLVKQVFPRGKVPLTPSLVRSTIKRYHEINNLPEPDDSELEQVAERLVDRRVQRQSVEQDFGI